MKDSGTRYREVDMNEQSERTHTHMFTLRVWVEDVGNGRFEHRGTLKHVLTGETHHFRDWQTLISHLEAVFKITCAAAQHDE